MGLVARLAGGFELADCFLLKHINGMIPMIQAINIAWFHGLKPYQIIDINH